MTSQFLAVFYLYKLELNKNKSMITRSSNGINFLGHRFIIKDNKTIIKITNGTKRKIKTGIRKNLNKYNNKLINYQKILVVSQIISIVIFLLIIKRYEITKNFINII